jgi:O-antigen/teichoic acid export membrane protein
VKHRLSTLGKQTLVYGASAAALQAVGLVTLPVFARVFTPAEYGALEIVIVGLAATMLLADLGLTAAAQRSFFDYGDHQPGERRVVLATAIVTAMSMAVAVAALIVMFRVPLADWLFDGQGYTTLLVLAAATIPFTVLANLMREVLRLHFRPWHYAISASLGAVVAGALSVSLVLWTDAGVNGVLIGTLAGSAIAAIYGLVVALGHVTGGLSRRELRTMLAFGLPLIPAVAALWGLSFMDRLMLSRLGSLSEVGEYAVAARFSMVVMFAITAFSLAFSPFILSIYAEDKPLEKQVRARTLTYLAVALSSLSLVLGLFAREAITIIAPAFGQAHEMVGILCIGVTLFGLSSVTMTGITFVRRAGLLAAYSLGAAVVNFGLNVALIPPLGGAGAAIATAVGYGLLAGGYYWHSQRLYPTPYHPRKAVLAVVLAACLLPLGLLPTGVGSIALKLAAIGVFVAGLLLLRVFDTAELAELRRLVRRTLGRPSDGPPQEMPSGV